MKFTFGLIFSALIFLSSAHALASAFENFSGTYTIVSCLGSSSDGQTLCLQQLTIQKQFGSQEFTEFESRNIDTDGTVLFTGQDIILLSGLFSTFKETVSGGIFTDQNSMMSLTRQSDGSLLLHAQTTVKSPYITTYSYDLKLIKISDDF